MRKVTEQVVYAFETGRAKKVSNTETDGQSLWLHGNKIAEHRSDGLWISNAGWASRTTKERLNGLRGVRIHQAKSKWYLNGEEWNGQWTKVNSNLPPHVDHDKVGTTFDTSTEWKASDGWRGRGEPVYAVCGANDTGMWSDSPCPSDVCEKELKQVTDILKKRTIPTKIITCETSNVFCVSRYVIVPPKYIDTARSVASEYIDNNYSRLLYKVN